MINWNWPATKYNTKVAWYTVIRRAVFLPFAWIAIVFLVSIVYVGWGKDTAKSVWEDLV